MNAILTRLNSLQVWQNFPPQGGSEYPFRAPATVVSDAHDGVRSNISVNGNLETHWISFHHLNSGRPTVTAFSLTAAEWKMRRLGKLLCEGTLTQATTLPFNSSSTFPSKLARFTPIAFIILL